MPEAVLSQEARSFIQQYLRTVDDLEVLMLVRSDTSRAWNATDVSDRLGLDPLLVLHRLAFLTAGGLLCHAPSAGPLYDYRYAPISIVLDRIAAEIAAVYTERREALADFIVVSQRGQLLAFANAFKFKRNGDG